MTFKTSRKKKRHRNQSCRADIEVSEFSDRKEKERIKETVFIVCQQNISKNLDKWQAAGKSKFGR